MNWWDDPEKYVTATDIEKHGKGASYLLRDLTVDRRTEHDKLTHMFIKALNKPIQLLPSQQKTLELSREAHAMGMTESIYIAERLQISDRAARYRLATLDRRLKIQTFQSDLKTFRSGDDQAIYNDTRMKVSQNDIDNMLRGRYVACQTQPYNADRCNGQARAYFGICRSCYETFTDARQYPDGMPDWVTFLVRDNRKQQREQARQDIIDMRINPLDIHDVA